MGYYSMMSIEENTAVTHKTKEQIERIIKRAKIFSEATPITSTYHKQPDRDTILNHELTIYIRKDNKIELIPIDEEWWQKWYNTDEIAYLLSQIVDNGYIIIVYTGEDGHRWGYKITKNSIYNLVFQQKFKKVDNNTLKTFKNNLYMTDNRKMFVINLTKKEYFYVFYTRNILNFNSRLSSTLSRLLYKEWNGDKVVIIDELYGIQKKQLWEPLLYEELIQNCREYIPNEEDELPKKWYKNKLFVNYDTNTTIDLYKEITVSALSTNKDSIVSPVIKKLLIKDRQTNTKWIYNKVGIIEENEKNI